MTRLIPSPHGITSLLAHSRWIQREGHESKHGKSHFGGLDDFQILHLVDDQAQAQGCNAGSVPLVSKMLVLTFRLHADLASRLSIRKYSQFTQFYANEMFLTVYWMVLSILTRKGRITCQNKNGWRSIWILDLKILKHSSWIGSSKYALEWALLGKLRLKLRVNLVTKGRICNKPSELCLETDKVELQFLISIQRLFQIDGTDFCTRQHRISNEIVKATKCFEWNRRWIEASLQWKNHDI